MGRTNPTFRDFLREFEAQWRPFRRALRQRHRADFDHLFDGARAHADAAGQRNATDPARAAMVAMLLAQERRRRRLRERVERLEAAVEVAGEGEIPGDDEPVAGEADPDPEPPDSAEG